MPSDKEPLMGLDRGLMQILDGRWLSAQIHVNDHARLSWKERLFSFPWKPWVKLKYMPTAYFAEDYIYVSFATYQKIKAGLIDIKSVVSG